MKIVREVHSNLEQQLDAYNKLLNFAEEKNVLLSDSQDRAKAKKLETLVKREVEVVQVLQELEKDRVEACDCEEFSEATKDADLMDEILSPVKAELKSVVVKLKDINDRNTLLISVSLKVVNKVFSVLRDLKCGNKMTYSRVNKKKPGTSYQSVNFTV
ncbi:MAG: flagellar protein FlgN [Candidatus Cloacimonetes bacterium]|nr:flagellar protein FlgN [Candidatus Cloacimonadota bacterium]